MHATSLLAVKILWDPSIALATLDSLVMVVYAQVSPQNGLATAKSTNYYFDCSLSIVIRCPLLTPLPNTEFVTDEGNMLNQTVLFRCVDGYMPSTPDTQFELTCTSDGVWSSELPSCITGNHTQLLIDAASHSTYTPLYRVCFGH